MRNIQKTSYKLLVGLFILAAGSFTMISCNDDGDTPENNDNNSGGNDWTTEVNVDLGGAFPVKADLTMDLKESTFNATVTTTEIAGQPEKQVTNLSGTRNGNDLNVKNQEFNVIPNGGSEEKVTIINADIKLDGNTMTGSGTMELDLLDGSDPIPGTFTITGTKK